MPPLDKLKRVTVRSRAEWRAWLQQNHAQTASIWLVSYKKIAGPLYLSYAEIVEEALCFGWIDSRPAKLDEKRSMLLLSPRRAGSAWSKINKERIARLEAQGLVAEPGWAKIRAAKADGSWSALDEVEAFVIPPDLASALRRAKLAAAFDALAPSRRRGWLDQLRQAKQPATRERRIAKLIATLTSSPQTSRAGSRRSGSA